MNDVASMLRRLKAIGRELSPEAVAASEALWAEAVLSALPPAGSIERELPYGEHERHRLDLFLPPGPTQAGALRPVWLFVHGGGFTGGDKHRPGSHLYDNVGRWAASEGWAAITMNYRLAPAHGWPAAAQDIARAIDWIGRHGADLGIDASRILLAGHSAGAAHAAGYIAQRDLHGAGHAGLRGAVLMSGIYDIEAMGTRPSVQSYFGRDPARHAVQSSVNGLADTRLPLLLTVAEEDPDGFHAQALTVLEHVAARWQRLPGFCVVPGHNHFTQVFHIGSRDRCLTPLLSAFAAANLGAAGPA